MKNLIKVVLKFPIINKRRYCNLCNKNSAYFKTFGLENDIFKKKKIISAGLRKNCWCPNCYSRDRYRWTYFVIKNYTNILTQPCKVLHFAPEMLISKKIVETNNQCEYITADLNLRYGAKLKIDVTNMYQFEDESFDWIIINHVLEHVKNEDSAFKELKRCIKKDGKIIFSVPYSLKDKTFEDDSIVSPEDCTNYYGQCDHVRLYGTDLQEILEKYGFKTKKYIVKDLLPRKQYIKYGFIPLDCIWILEKQ
jgi:predicted SAM-dependent methyltransferase